jgi:hypothetical protein
MKFNRNLIISFVLLVIVASLYRVLPRPMGFAPQIAMALFAGAICTNKKFAFLLPLLSMFLSDALYQFLFNLGYTKIEGFYDGQLGNYLLICGLTVIGFFVKQRNVLSIAAGSLAAPTAYFLISNFMVWIGGGGYNRPKTFDGLMMVYADGLPFYQMSFLATLFFSAVFFGGYYLVTKSLKTQKVIG